MDKNNEQFFHSLLEELPLYAEQDNIREEITESELISKIREKARNKLDDSFSVDSAITIVRRLLEALTLLDPVELKNGTLEAEVTVKAVSLNVKHLMRDKPIVFYELVMKCKDKDHKLFGNAEKDF